jgi:hypothetical protein
MKLKALIAVIICVIALVALIRNNWVKVDVRLWGAGLQLETTRNHEPHGMEPRANVGPSSPK